MTARTPVYWAYCNYASYEGRLARGFVLATSIAEATAKARDRIERDKRNFARRVGMSFKTLTPATHTYRVLVWRDPNRRTAPRCRHYTEKG